MTFQGLLGYPRNTGVWNKNEILQLLQGNGVEIGFGAEFLWPTQVIQPADATSFFDISDCIMDGSYISQDNTAKVSRSCSLVIDPGAFKYRFGVSLEQAYAAPGGTYPSNIPAAAHAFYWGNPRTRVRVFQTMTAEGIGTAKFYVGTFIMSSPEAPMDTADPVYTVTGYDPSSMFDIPLTDDISYPAGTNIFNSVTGIMAMYGNNFGGAAPWLWFGAILGDNTGAAMPYPMSFAADGSTTYLDVINALLVAMSYYPAYSDEHGSMQYFRWVDPRTAPIDWVFDFTDPKSNLVDPTGTWTPNYWQVPNQWRFIQQGLAITPTEGVGQYTVRNQNSGPCSIDRQLGRVIQKYQQLNAASQSDLVNQANAILVQDMSMAETLSFNSSPIPLAGHRDIVQVINNNIEPNMFAATGPSNTRRCVVQSWELPLNGDEMSWVVGTVG